ncbi:MAG: hypothetical protein P8179_13400 [Candidatus Thiodiazotropha sp.]|jgi:hypothetical protein
MEANTLKNKVHSFMHFLNIYSCQEVYEEICSFYSIKKTREQKEVIYDRGQLLLMVDGKQFSSIMVPIENDRIVKFDGTTIEEVNPFAYIEGFEIQMKGDGSKRRRRSSRKGGSSSNNNNNNNNG